MRSQASSLLRLMRPLQWVKNGFVLVGLLFGHAWNDPQRLTQALLACAAFCLLSSAVYVMNDLIDREADRRHPLKRRRPLASGEVGVPAALVLMAACLAGGYALVALSANRAAWLFSAYVVLNIAYTLGLKHVVVLDVFIIAAGFMLRILVGTLGIGIAPSQWLLLCGLMLTLFLGFAKRRAELGAMGASAKTGEAGSGHAATHRRVLEHYSPALLDQMMTVATAGTIVSYSLYTVSPETLALHGTTHLIYTVPLVIYGMFRYLFLLHRRGGGGDPTQQLLTDPHLLAALAGWVTLVLLMLGRWL
ncbi:MAG: decaprenyl-phosphate phosphoribosyltransferase [Proteobacteria bacterium]|nr:decaprenyl-phosphate phosphoribosyltransferase [Pseudomonadota bacterium]